MSKTIGIAVLAFIRVLALSGVQAQESKQSKASDMFMKQAMQGDMAEIQVGKLAQEKGEDQQVKDPSVDRHWSATTSKICDKAEVACADHAVTRRLRPDARCSAERTNGDL